VIQSITRSTLSGSARLSSSAALAPAAKDGDSGLLKGLPTPDFGLKGVAGPILEGDAAPGTASPSLQYGGTGERASVLTHRREQRRVLALLD